LSATATAGDMPSLGAEKEFPKQRLNADIISDSCLKNIV